MRNSVVGLVFGILILFVSLIILPTYFIGLINWRTDMNKCQTAARNFVDTVIDNGRVTDRALSDLNLELAGCSSTFTYEYYREERVANPVDPSTGTIDIEWVYVDVTPDMVWRTGDFCTIVIRQQGLNVFQRISAALLGTQYNKMEIRLTGMVR